EVAAAVQLRRDEKGKLGRARYPDVDLIQRKRRSGVGQHADDRVRSAVERQELAEYRRIAVEALLPHRRADEHDVLASRPVFARGEVPAEPRFETECRQQRHRRLQTDELLGIAPAGQCERIARRQREVAEYLLRLLYGEEARIREADASELLYLARRA